MLMAVGRTIFCVVCFAIALLFCARAHGAEVDYAKDIKPLLKARCYACHGALKQKADLRLDTAAAMRKGGKEGDVVAGNRPMLLERVSATDLKERMPPEGLGSALSAEEIAKLRAWIEAG